MSIACQLALMPRIQYGDAWRDAWASDCASIGRTRTTWRASRLPGQPCEKLANSFYASSKSEEAIDEWTFLDTGDPRAAGRRARLGADPNAPRRRRGAPGGRGRAGRECRPGAGGAHAADRGAA